MQTMRQFYNSKQEKPTFKIKVSASVSSGLSFRISPNLTVDVGRLGSDGDKGGVKNSFGAEEDLGLRLDASGAAAGRTSEGNSPTRSCSSPQDTFRLCPREDCPRDLFGATEGGTVLPVALSDLGDFNTPAGMVFPIDSFSPIDSLSPIDSPSNKSSSLPL